MILHGKVYFVNIFLLVIIAYISPLPPPVLSLAQMAISIIIDREFRGALTPAWLRKTARAALNAEHAGRRAEVGLVVTGQAKIRELNKRYLDEDAPTDVLSFPMTQSPGSFVNPPDGAIQLGEVVISYPQAAEQAAERGHPVEKEVALLIVHGILHLLGYDHDIPSRKKKMVARESTIMRLIEESLL